MNLQPTNRKESQRLTDKMIEDKLGSSNMVTKIVAWLTGTVIGPVISFFKKKWFQYSFSNSWLCISFQNRRGIFRKDVCSFL